MGDDLERALAHADLLTDTDRHADALAALAPALAAHPDNSRVHLTAAICHLGIESNAHLALQHAQQAARFDPDTEQAHRVAALALLKLREPRQAMQAASRAVQLAPNLWVTHYVYAHTVLGDRYLGHLAATAASETLRLAPHEPSAHLLAARVRLYGGYRPTTDDRVAAEAHIREALRLDPQNPEAVHELAEVELAGRNPGKAVTGFLGALRLDPQSSMAGHGLSRALWSWVWRVHLLLGVIGMFVLRPIIVGEGESGQPGNRAVAVVAALVGLASVAFVGRQLRRSAPGRVGAVLRAIWRTDKLGLIWAAVLPPVAVANVFVAVLPTKSAEAVLVFAMAALLLALKLSWLRLLTRTR